MLLNAIYYKCYIKAINTYIKKGGRSQIKLNHPPSETGAGGAGIKLKQKQAEVRKQ